MKINQSTWEAFLIISTVFVATFITYRLFFYSPSAQMSDTQDIFSDYSDGDKLILDFEGDKAPSLELEVAKSNRALSKGLMDRESLGENSGMIFIFPASRIQSFWMKNTLISLDMIFIDENYRIVTIIEDAKPNQTKETYQSSKPAKYVIEVNAGWSERYGISEGDKIRVLE